jgi:hypothetical protein
MVQQHAVSQLHIVAVYGNGMKVAAGRSCAGALNMNPVRSGAPNQIRQHISNMPFGGTVNRAAAACRRKQNCEERQQD